MDFQPWARNRVRRRITRGLWQWRYRRTRRSKLIGHAFQPRALFGSAERAFMHPHATNMQ
jgi:hypothetical protein